LSETLVALIESLQAPPGSGLVITGATMEVPMEVGSARQGDRLVFYGTVPHTRWKSGVLPVTHLGRLRIELVSDPGGNTGLGRAPESADAG